MTRPHSEAGVSPSQVSLAVTGYVAWLLGTLGDEASWSPEMAAFAVADRYAQKVYPVPPPPPPPIHQLIEELIGNLERAAGR